MLDLAPVWLDVSPRSESLEEKDDKLCDVGDSVAPHPAVLQTGVLGEEVSVELN